MENMTREKPPVWFPIAPIMVVVFLYLVWLLAGQITLWLELGQYLGLSIIYRYLIGIPLIIIGLVFFVWGFAQLRPAAAIGFAQKLRTTGVYGLTRNPMYFGLSTAIWGSGFLLDDLTLLLMALIWSCLNLLSVTLWEEKQIYNKFGEEYLEYKKRVPRFIPIKWNRGK
jgi:protein-S-isoprenylcysteine O-methyltransferase Ste14